MKLKRRKRSRWASTLAGTGWGESTFAEVAWDKSRSAAARWAGLGIVFGAAWLFLCLGWLERQRLRIAQAS